MAQPPDGGKLQGWDRLAKVFREISDLDFEILREGEAIQLTLAHCPDCLGHRSEDPCCAGMLGWLDGAHALLFPGVTASIEEKACQAAGANVCTFVVTTQVES